MTAESVASLQSNCMRLLALVGDTTFSLLPITLLPASLSDLVEQLRQDVKLFVRAHQSIVDIQPTWICVSSACRIDYPATLMRCIEATDPTTAFQLAAVNALHQRCVTIWNSLDYSQRGHLNKSPNPVVVAAAWRITERPYLLFYDDACSTAARNGWSTVLQFWLTLIGDEHELEPELGPEEAILLEEARNDARNVRQQPEFRAHLLPQNDERQRLVARLIIIAVKNQQWHILNQLPVDDAEEAFYHFFPDGRIQLSFLHILASSPRWVRSKTDWIARALLKWAPRLDVERLRADIRCDLFLTKFVESLLKDVQ
ncbi:hypothetical protein Tcan_10459 [Toxocara canis]|uniref:Uncharacterized protein n=1 Tax=Toxocara canis TaxID=6265 RepID=A0A0B2VEH2_TOXCA|nr:hypothetical protein Tcan_10459 [Toxocara canis]